MEAEPPIGIVIVDDHPLIRKGLRTMLAFEPDFAVLGEATDGPEAIDLVLTAMPDVVLLDLHMPGGSGLDACREITRVSPQSRVLMLTLYDDDESVFSAVRAGARGYLLKDSDEEEIIRAIPSVAAAAAMHAAQDELNRHWATEGKAPFGLGIGLSTGLVAAAAAHDHRTAQPTPNPRAGARSPLRAPLPLAPLARGPCGSAGRALARTDRPAAAPTARQPPAPATPQPR